MNRRTRIALIAAAVLLSGCGSASAQPTSVYTPVSGPWRPVVESEATPAPSEAPGPSYEPEPSYRVWAHLSPSPRHATVPRPTRRPASPPPRQPSRGGHRLAGLATYYAYVSGQAAAARALREAIGPHWRGTRVWVCIDSKCLSVVLTDFESSAIPGRLIDLDSRTFAAFAPLSRGVLHVTVRW